MGSRHSIYLRRSQQVLLVMKNARVVELVDTGDLKSPDFTVVTVQVRSRAPYFKTR